MKEHMIEELFDCLSDLKNVSDRVPFLPEDVSRSEMNVLYAVYSLSRELTSVKVTDISRKLAVQSPNVIALVKKLEARALVKKCADKNDKRVVHVVLTMDGMHLVDRYILRYYQMLADAFDGEDEDIRIFIKTLRRLRKRIDKIKTLYIEELGGEVYE